MIAAKKPNVIRNMLNAMGNIQIHILHATFHGSKKVMCPHCTPHCNSCPDREQTQICQVLVMLGNLFCETLNGIRENNNTACVEENNNFHPYTIRLSNQYKFSSSIWAVLLFSLIPLSVSQKHFQG